ncbi:unnamed protein product [Spirodela intermedia]|uniref:Uncharacterized protein n=1 Tax=Spirodela intermedia TaxID=51605 RepID=A0A7I8L1W9_SPIIN|nr:unnamed protein product [Spirodela intermedia]
MPRTINSSFYLKALSKSLSFEISDGYINLKLNKLYKVQPKIDSHFNLSNY